MDCVPHTCGKKYVIWFHYNKPFSQRQGTHKWSVHYRGSCWVVDSIDCQVATHSKTNKKQPYVVMRGLASSLEVVPSLEPFQTTAIIL